MEKNQFKSAVKEYIESKRKDLKIELNNEYSLSITEEGETETLNLENIWREFLASGEDITIIDTVLDVFKASKEKDKQILNFNKDKIFPVIRYSNEDSKEKNEDIVEQLSYELGLKYVLDFPTHMSFVTKDMLNDLFTSDDLWTSAVTNLVNQGWTKETNTEHSTAGKLYLYKEFDRNYQVQFLLEAMYENELGPEFYVIFPTKHISMVLVPNTPNKESVLAGILKLKEFAVKLSVKESYPISEKVYRVKDGKLYFVG